MWRYTKLGQSVNMCAPIMYLELFLSVCDMLLNENKGSSFHYGERKKGQNLRKTDNKQ